MPAILKGWVDRVYAYGLAWETDPIPYRTQNGGDYDIPSCELKPGLSAGRHGFDIHLAHE